MDRVLREVECWVRVRAARLRETMEEVKIMGRMEEDLERSLEVYLQSSLSVSRQLSSFRILAKDLRRDRVPRRCA